MEIRHPSVAGAFYPSSKKELEASINKFLEKCKKVTINNIKALIVPHAGYSYSGIVAASGYSLLKNLPKKHYKVILIGPSHHVGFYGVSASKSDYWETPLGNVKVTKSSFKEAPYAHESEHSLEVQLPFLQSVLKDFEILPLLTNKVDISEFAKELIKYIDENTIIIASSDLSHYHDYETAKKLDAFISNAIPKLDIKKIESADACGLIAIIALVQVAIMKGWHAKLIDYKNSGDTSGDKSRVVGYGCYAFY